MIFRNTLPAVRSGPSTAASSTDPNWRSDEIKSLERTGAGRDDNDGRYFACPRQRSMPSMRGGGLLRPRPPKHTPRRGTLFVTPSAERTRGSSDFARTNCDKDAVRRRSGFRTKLLLALGVLLWGPNDFPHQNPHLPGDDNALRERTTSGARYRASTSLLFAAAKKRERTRAANNGADKKVTVKETIFDSPVDRMEWAGENNEVVLVLTKRGRLHRSDDGGVRWDDITAQLGDANDNSFDSFVVSPADKRYLLAVGTSKSHFVSSDAGRNWRKLKQKATIHTFLFHATRGSWALLSSWTDSCRTGKREESGGEPCVHNLFVTKDLGVTFTLVTSYVVQFAWGEESSEPDRIYFSHFNQKTGNQPKLLAWSSGVDFCMSDNLGATQNTLVAAGNKFGVFTGYIFVAKLENAATQSVSLMVSTDHGKTFGRAKIGEQLEEKSYTILDTSEGAVVLHVHHGHVADVDIGHVYVSDSNGLRYTKSLAANVRSPDGTCDFDKVGGVDGIYMANQVDTAAEADVQTDEEDSEETGAATNSGAKSGESRGKQGKSESRVRTVISFDKGGKWQVIAPPEFDSLGQRISCDSSKCSLHLHGTTTAMTAGNFAPFYSMPNAAGIILGTGNVGQYLRYEDANTYMSIDGGLTWIEAHKKPYIYEIGDHGGLLVMAPSTKKTKEVIFSWNEGTNWFEFEMAKSRIEVDNIVTAPNSVSTQFIVHGARGSSGVIYHMDFAALGMPTCANPLGAGSVASDYYRWTPADGRNRKCLLGKEMVITRRKPTAECFNGEKFERPSFQKNCECSRLNYQCEMGFRRGVEDTVYASGGSEVGDCALDDADLAAPESCSPGSSISVDAYRKTPGDTCENGWQPSQVQMTCPSGRSGFLWNFVQLVLVSLLACFFWQKRGEIWLKVQSTRGFESFGDVKYGGIQMDAMPETAFDSVGNRWDAGYDNDDFLNDAGFQEDAPTLMQYQDEQEPVKISRGLDSAAESIPRLEAPSSTGFTTGGLGAPPGDPFSAGGTFDDLL